MDNMEKRKDEKRQLILYTIILVFIIGIAIYFNVFANKENTTNDNTSNTTSTINMNEVVIDGLTEESLEDTKAYMDQDKYEQYKETFEQIRKGEIEYEEGLSLEPKNVENVTEEEVKKENTKQEETLNNSSWHYYITEDGTVTNTKVYDNVDYHNEEK